MAENSSPSYLDLAQTWADLVSKVLGGMALVVAAWWTYTNFTVERTHDPTMEVTVTPTVQPLRGKQVLLNVDVYLKNIGKVAIAPRFPLSDQDRDLGLEVSIVEIEPLGPSSADPNLAAVDANSDELRWFDWTAGHGEPKRLIHKRNLLATNEDFCTGRYQLNPGVNYREPFACIVQRNKLYAIRARFWTDEGSVADLAYVDTFTSEEATPVVAAATAPTMPALLDPPAATATKSETENRLR